MQTQKQILRQIPDAQLHIPLPFCMESKSHLDGLLLSNDLAENVITLHIHRQHKDAQQLTQIE